MRIFIGFLILLLAGCKPANRNNVIPISIDTSGAFQKKIPEYGKGSGLFWFNIVKAESSGLGLDNIDNGFNGLQLRVRLGHSMTAKNHMVVITCVNNAWQAQVF